MELVDLENAVLRIHTDPRLHSCTQLRVRHGKGSLSRILFRCLEPISGVDAWLLAG